MKRLSTVGPFKYRTLGLYCFNDRRTVAAESFDEALAFWKALCRQDYIDEFGEEQLAEYRGGVAWKVQKIEQVHTSIDVIERD